MKKFNLLLFFIGLLTYTQAQVGINTTSPLGNTLLHIDPDGKTELNTSTGVIENSSDDIVISSTGNLGIGTLDPQAKVHIVSATAGKGLCIADGTQGLGKILKSDDDGNASWINRPKPGGTVANYYYLGKPERHYVKGYSHIVISSPITEDGNYIVFLRWWGSLYQPSSTYVVGYLYLTSSSSDKDDWALDQHQVLDQTTYSLDVGAVPSDRNNTFGFTDSFSAYFLAGQYLKIYLAVVTDDSWILGTYGGAYFNPSATITRI